MFAIWKKIEENVLEDFKNGILIKMEASVNHLHLEVVKAMVIDLALKKNVNQFVF